MNFGCRDYFSLCWTIIYLSRWLLLPLRRSTLQPATHRSRWGSPRSTVRAIKIKFSRKIRRRLTPICLSKSKPAYRSWLDCRTCWFLNLWTFPRHSWSDIRYHWKEKSLCCNWNITEEMSRRCIPEGRADTIWITIPNMFLSCKKNCRY